MEAVTTRGASEVIAEYEVRPLSAEDLSILELENQTVAGHTCKVIVLEERIDPAALRAAVGARLARAPELSMRLCEHDGRPCWTISGPPVLDDHLLVAPFADGPVDSASFRAEVARLFGERLDRSLPLWRIDVVPELAGAGTALIWRIHHALADGMTAMKIAASTLWDQAPADHPAAVQSPLHPAPPISRKARLANARAVLREAPQPWRRSPFAGRITAERSVSFLSLQLEHLRRVARAHGKATVNDAVLTVVAGGLRRWLEHHHGHLGSVRVKVPVSLHSASSAPADAGNRDSFFCVDLPLGHVDPLERLEAIHRATKIRKEAFDAQRLDTLMRDLERVPRLRRFAERIMTSPRSFALNVSNVPGPREPIQVAGSRVLAMYSLAEIRSQHALRVAVTSLGGSLNFGLVADPTLVEDIDVLATSMRAEADALSSRLRAV